MIAACWMCGTPVEVALVGVVVSVVVVVSLAPTLLMRSNNLNGEHLLISSYEERERVDDLSCFDYLSPFCFLLIEFHCTF